MSFKPQITQGVQSVPDLMMIYGVEGVGKTTFASKAPNPLFLDLEHGTRRIDVKRESGVTDIHLLWQFLNWFHSDNHGYSSLVIDSVSVLEQFIFKQVCADSGVSNIEEAGGGFMKGYIMALKYWQMLKTGIQTIQASKKTNVILIGHALVKKFDDPTTNSSYDRYRIKLEEKGSAFLREWLDFVGFANYEVTISGKGAKQRAGGGERRILHTERRPAYDAKNRLSLPLKIPFAYEEYAKAAHASPEVKAAALRENIRELIALVKDEAMRKAMEETVVKAGSNLTDLALIQERINQRLDEQEESKNEQ